MFYIGICRTVNKLEIDLEKIHVLRKEASNIADQLVSQIDSLVGVCLVGSLADSTPELDQFSDIDMYAYYSTELPTVSELANDLKINKKHLRKRRHCLEITPDYRKMILSIDVDVSIKFFPFSFLEIYLLQNPSLADQYLAELHCFDNSIILHSKGEGFSRTVKIPQIKKETIISELLEIAFDKYCKTLHFALMQGVERKPTPAFHACIGYCIDTLLMLSYFSASQYPPVIKWRSHRKYLGKIPRGNDIYEILDSMYINCGGNNPHYYLNIVKKIEKLTSNYYKTSPWSKYSDHWWWHGYHI